MKKNELKHIKQIQYSDFDLWDTKRYSYKEISSKYPIVKLGLHIKEESRKYKLSDKKDEKFGILGVNNKNGIFDAYEQYGKEINQAYKKVETNWLAYNPYRINVGSIGLKTEEHKYDFISPAYVVFSCLETVLPNYLFIILKTKTFRRIINERTTGSVRQNLTFSILQDLDFPLPSLLEQQQIIREYNAKINYVAKLKSNIKEFDSQMEDYLLSTLGLALNLKSKTERSYLREIEYFKIERWSFDYLSQYSNLDFLYNGKYSLMKLKLITLNYQYGISIKAQPVDGNLPMLRMGNIIDGELDTTDLKFVNKEQIQSKFILNRGDLLFNRTNSKELVGKTAVFDLEGEYTFASYLIRLKVDPFVVNVKYINYLFNSSVLKIQKDIVSRQITGQANINAQEMLEFLFPIPPLSIQNIIVKNLDYLLEQKKSLQTQVLQINECAGHEIEQIFNKYEN